MADLTILLTESFHVDDFVTPPTRQFTVTDAFTVTIDIPVDSDGFVAGAVFQEIYTLSETIFIHTASPLTAPAIPYDVDL